MAWNTDATPDLRFTPYPGPDIKNPVRTAIIFMGASQEAVFEVLQSIKEEILDKHSSVNEVEDDVECDSISNIKYYCDEFEPEISMNGYAPMPGETARIDVVMDNWCPIEKIVDLIRRGKNIGMFRYVAQAEQMKKMFTDVAEVDLNDPDERERYGFMREVKVCEEQGWYPEWGYLTLNWDGCPLAE